MAIRRVAVVVTAVAVIGLLAAVAVIIAANYGVDLAMPTFKL